MSAESVPLPRALSRTLQDEAHLGHLAARMRRSQACLAAVLPLVPASLRPHLLAGPWDETGWTLLTRQPAAITKMRHLQPLLLRGLKEAGIEVPAVRIHVLLGGT